MSDRELTRQEMQDLFRATAAVETPEGLAAYKAFAAALTVPILQEIRDASMVRQLFAVEPLAPGAQASYPVADDFSVSVWTLPGLGYIAQQFLEGVGEEIFVPTFSLDTSADWKVDYARDARVDIAERAARAAARAIIDKEEECGWRVIVPAATTNFAGKGLLGARNAPIYEITSGTGAKFLSKELINLMLVGFKRTKRNLTDLYISPEDAADIREWTDTEVDPVTRREIFTAAGMGNIWKVALHEVYQLGATGKYNINSTADWGIFGLTGGSFNNYTPTVANVVTAAGAVTTPGETQVYGFDLSVNDSLVMPVRKEFSAIDDPTLLRYQKQGFYGWETIGFACLDSRMLGIGIIDRS
jgi:hypothetical protein